MSRAGHFDDSPVAVFTRPCEAQAAPRRLRVSFVLVLILALATILVGLLARPYTDRAPLPPAWTVRAM